ncbi:complement component C9 [Elgaria multicarinata webbii]|uniref:complement component C9 n=1 Tax=Elgaria multicarinata webbii TaxID=159646 RepID=UPI002FCD6471
MSTFLPLIGALLIFGFASAGKTRLTRQPAALAPIDCLLSRWSEWGPCNSCAKERYRSRSVVKYGQFGGKPCVESLGDRQSCVPDTPCPEEEVDCGNDFTCENGQCIKSRLMCNTEDDCGDVSDEDNCEDMRPAPCRDRIIDVSEIGRTAGRGLNILGMEPKGSPFHNEFYNGVCDRVRDGNSGIYYRKPWNVAVLNYDTKGDKRFTSEDYDDQVTTLKHMFSSRDQTFKTSLSLKLSPTEARAEAAPLLDTGDVAALPAETEDAAAPLPEGADAPAAETEDAAKVPVKKEVGGRLKFDFTASRSTNISNFLEESKGKKQVFLHVKANLELGNYIMRRRDIRLTDTFVDDLKYLPSTYDRGEYFTFLEMYGTHYAHKGTVGGRYELVYVLDQETMSKEGVTTEDVSSCLGYNINVDIASGSFIAEHRNNDCNKGRSTHGETSSSKPIIHDVISLVEGGKTIALARLKEMLSRDGKVIDVEDYVQWAATVPDSPTVIKQDISPISTLVPLKMHDSELKKRNLEQAVEDYVAEYNVCKCQPCQNGGTVILVNGRCECGCSAYFKGEACEIPTSTLRPGQVATDGSWSCWSSWSSCEHGEHVRTRRCNNPERSATGKPCAGEETEAGHC